MNLAPIIDAAAHAYVLGRSPYPDEMYACAEARREAIDNDARRFSEDPAFQVAIETAVSFEFHPHLPCRGPVVYRTQEELDAALELWQKRLRLQDWTISMTLMHGPLVGAVRRSHAMSKIIIRFAELHGFISASEEIEGRPHDMEVTLVHELIHCHYDAFCPEDEDSLAFDLWEQSIEQMAKAVVAIARADA